MVFSSSIFLFVFLPLFLSVYYVVPARLRTLVILLGSYVFFGWWRYDFLFLLIGVTTWSWAWSHAVARAPSPALKRLALTIGVVGDLGVLAGFKYTSFVMGNLAGLAVTLGLEPPPVPSVLLPVGISFYTFQALSYLVDVYRGDAVAERSPLNFSAFIVVFPQLIAGPVLRYKDVADQFHSRPHSFALFSEGAERFMLGFCMKVLVADPIAPLVTTLFERSAPTLAESWLGVTAYTVQLYFDFAGYSHMAVGLGLLIGFRFMENFDQPYISSSITEFWRRWHISLSTWLRDYLYVPLGGNRRGERRTYLNLMATMVLGGLWHGAAWTFLAWGLWHGVWLSLERHNRHRLPTGPLAVARTMLVVMVGWVLFRSTDLPSAGRFFAGMVGLHGVGLSGDVAWRIAPLSVVMVLVGLAVVYVPGRVRLERLPLARFVPVLVSLGFVVAVLRLTAMSHSPFLYFQF